MLTLASYINYLLTGKKVVGIGEASGIFPVDKKTNNYDLNKIEIFNNLLNKKLPYSLLDIFPSIVPTGVVAGYLTEEGRDLLDESKELDINIPFVPPEGDMQTGVVSTNAIKTNTGSASIGTSSNINIIISKDISVHEEVNLMLTPNGNTNALIHVSNGTTEINHLFRLFKELLNKFNVDPSDDELYKMMFNSSLKGKIKEGKIYPIDYYSGELVTHLNSGRPLVIKEPDSKMDLANLMLSHIYSLLATIRIGVDILREKEGIKLDSLIGHGGFFKTEYVGQNMLSRALNVPVSTLDSASSGGPYGMAILASYLFYKDKYDLESFLDDLVFKDQKVNTVMASNDEIEDFNLFLDEYKKLFKIEEYSLSI